MLGDNTHTHHTHTHTLFETLEMVGNCRSWSIYRTRACEAVELRWSTVTAKLGFDPNWGLKAQFVVLGRYFNEKRKIFMQTSQDYRAHLKTRSEHYTQMWHSQVESFSFSSLNAFVLLLLKERFTQKWNFSHYVLTLMRTELNISGATQQNSAEAFS